MSKPQRIEGLVPVGFCNQKANPQGWFLLDVGPPHPALVGSVEIRCLGLGVGAYFTSPSWQVLHGLEEVWASVALPGRANKGGSVCSPRGLADIR